MKVKVLIETLSNGKAIYESIDEFFQFAFTSDATNVLHAHQKAEYIFRQQIVAQLGHDPLLDLLRTLSCSYAVFWTVVAEPIAPKMVTDRWTATVYRDILTMNPDIQQLVGEDARKLYDAKKHVGPVPEVEPKKNKYREALDWFRSFCKR